MKYRVNIHAVWIQEWEVEASSEDEAITKVVKYGDGDVKSFDLSHSNVISCIAETLSAPSSK